MNYTKLYRLSLRRQLVFNAILGVSIPAIFIGGLVYFFLNYHLDIIESNFSRNQETLALDLSRNNIVSRAINVSRQIDVYLVSRIREARTWSSERLIVQSTRAAHAKHMAEGLGGISIEAVEFRFQIQKSLGYWPQTDRFLEQLVAKSPYFSDISITDGNGFNVALTHPTADFVQSDEVWWKSAWKDGYHVGHVEYDDAAAVWSISISIRIDQPVQKKPLGVLKAVLSIEAVQGIADRAALLFPGGRAYITTKNGALIAETDSAHAPQRIMSTRVNIKKDGEPSLRESFSAEKSGFKTDNKWMAGFARTGGREIYDATVSGFRGLDWIVILQKPLDEIKASLNNLRELDGALRDWRLMLAMALGFMWFLSTLFAIALAVMAARQYSASLVAVREIAVRAVRGQTVTRVAVGDVKEFVKLRDAVLRLSKVLALLKDGDRHS